MVECNIKGTDYVLHEGVTIVGRGLEADIIIDSTKISRMHARFIIKGDQIEIEDLGSKNGTFVNGEKISEKKAVSRTDTLKLADIPCALILPETKKQTGQGKKVSSEAKVAPKKSESRDLNRILLFGGILLIVVIVGIALLSTGGEEPEIFKMKKEARELIDDVRSSITSITEGENIEANKRGIENLDHYEARLGEIPAALKEEIAEAKILKSDIRNLKKRIEDKNTEIGRQDQAMTEYNRTVEQFTGGSLPPMQAITQFQQIETTYAGTKASELAGEKVLSIRTQVKQDEETFISQAQSAVLSLLQSEQFEEALKKADDVIGKEFKMISPEQLEPLKKTKTDIAERAKEYFSKQVEAIVSDAQKGDWNTCLERLKEAYTKVDSINGTESVYKKAEQDINAVRDKKAAEEKQKIADEIKAGEDLFTKRMYKQAYQKYAAVIAQISDTGQKNELEKKKRLIGLFAFAKKTVIEYIARKEGAALASGGNIKSVDEKQFIAVGEEGGTVNMQWHELKYMDFVGLLKQALAEKPDPKGYAIMGYMCLESGDKNSATTYFSQAIQISPEIKNTYPDLFRESMQRLKK